MDRRTLRRGSLLMLGALFVVAPAAAAEVTISDADAPAVADTVRQFLEGNVPHALSTGGAQNDPRSPFGTESGLDPADSAAINLTDTFQFAINPGPFQAFSDGDFDGDADFAFGDVVRTTMNDGFSTTPLGQPYQDVIQSGSVPQSGSPPVESLQGFLMQMGLDPNSTEVQQLNGIPVKVIRSPSVSEDIPLNGQPVLVSGGIVEGSLPLDNSCGGFLIDLGRLDAISGDPLWTPADFAPEDLFEGGSQAIVGRCLPGQGWLVDRMVNQGSGFRSQPASSHMVLWENGWMSVTPFRETANSVGDRQFAFLTPESNPFTPDSTAYTSNTLPGLRGGTTPVLVFDPFYGSERVGVFPLQMGFSGGPFDSGVPCVDSYTQLFEAHVMVGSDGMYPTSLYQFASGQITTGTLSVNGSTSLFTEGGGDGWTESYDLMGSSGSYLYMPDSTECPYDVTIFDGYDAMVSDDAFVVTAPDEPDSPASSDSGSVDDVSPGSEDEDVVVAPVPIGSGDGDGGGINWPLIAIGGLTLAGGTTLYVANRRKLAADNLPLWSGTTVEEPASVALTDEDLARYAKYGIGDHAVAQHAEASSAAVAAEVARGDEHAADVQAGIDAEIAAAKDIELLPMPRIPDMRNIALTDNPLLAFGFEFVTVMETDLTTGRSEERLAEFIVAMPDALEKAGENVVQQVGTAYTGWGEIFNNSALLGELDDAVVDAGGNFVDLGARYLEEAEKDSDQFVTMTADITANLQVQAVIGKGFQTGGTALANRLQGGVGAAEVTAASGTTTATRTGTSTPVRPPPPRSGTGTTPPAGPTPAPTAPAAPAPSPLAGYGPGAARVPLQSGAGTPLQLAPNGCGAAVFRGICRDLALAVPREIEVLIRGATQRIGGIRLWNPNGGFNLGGMAQTMRSMLPATVRVIEASFHGIANKVDDIASFMANNPGARVMVGLRWRGAFQGGAGHWVRVEAIRNGWVALGDPATGFTIAVPASNLNALAECAIAVVP